jgi:hypothetical protein
MRYNQSKHTDYLNDNKYNNIFAIITAYIASAMTAGLCCYALFRSIRSKIKECQKKLRLHESYDTACQYYQELRERQLPAKISKLNEIKLNELSLEIEKQQKSNKHSLKDDDTAELLAILSLLNPYTANETLLHNENLACEYTSACNFFIKRFTESFIPVNEIKLLCLSAYLINLSNEPRTKSIIKQVKFKHQLTSTFSISNILFTTPSQENDPDHYSINQLDPSNTTLTRFDSFNSNAKLNYELRQILETTPDASNILSYLNILEQTRILPPSFEPKDAMNQLLNQLNPTKESTHESCTEAKRKKAWNSILRVICFHGALYQSPEIRNSIILRPKKLLTQDHTVKTYF